MYSCPCGLCVLLPMQALVSETLAGPFYRWDKECTENEGTLIKFMCQLPVNTQIQTQAYGCQQSSSRQWRQRTIRNTDPSTPPSSAQSSMRLFPEALSLLVSVLAPQTLERTELKLTVEKLWYTSNLSLRILFSQWDYWAKTWRCLKT